MSGGVKSFTFDTGTGSRSVTKLDLPWLYTLEDRLVAQVASSEAGSTRLYAGFARPE
ncbi:hypothetical protein [Nitrospira sp. Nam74]